LYKEADKNSTKKARAMNIFLNFLLKAVRQIEFHLQKDKKENKKHFLHTTKFKNF